MKINEAATVLGTTPARATSRLAALGYTETCGRCLGSGRYSWNQMDGDRCYGCGGSGKRLVRLTDKLVGEAKARIEAGELADYFARAKARGAIKAAAAHATKTWRESFISKTYSGPEMRALPASIVVKSPEFRAQGLVNALWDAVNRLEREAHGTTDPRATLAGIEELDALIKMVDTEFNSYVAEHGLTQGAA